jgi:GntR family transcriptional regulator
MEALSLDHATRNIDFMEVSPFSRVAAALDLAPKDRVYRITRLRLVESEPVAAHITYLTDRDFPLIAQEGPVIQSITEYLKAKQCAATISTLEMVTRLPNLKEQTLLKCPSLVPVMKMETYFIKETDRTTIGYGEVIFRGDRFVQQIQP